MSDIKRDGDCVDDGHLYTNNEKNSDCEQIKLYKKRWIILFIFMMYAAVNAAQWIEYSIITNIIMKYYNVSALAVDWTSMIYMALYTPLMLPSSYIVDAMGLRAAAFVGGLGTTIGSGIKLFSASPDLYWVTFLGQIMLSIAAVPILSLPPRIAAVWFGSNEVSTACSLGVFGTQLGMAVGFVLPAIIVKNHDNIEDIGHDLYIMFWVFFAIMIPISLAIIFYFPERPKLPPSPTQVLERQSQRKPGENFFGSVKEVLKNKAFLLHFIAYGINIGVFSAVGTLLNQFILTYFPNSEEDAGRMGLVMVVVGMIGSVAFGVFLDKTHKYKETTLGIYLMSSLSIVLFMYALEAESKLFVYIACAIVGLFTNAYMPVGFEFAIEVTFPSPESTTSGILMAMTQFLGVLFTLMLGRLFAIWGTFWALSSQAILLLIGTIITYLVPNNLRRQAAFKERREKDSKEKQIYSPVAQDECNC